MQQLLVRPQDMKRIDSPALAQAYIDEQVAAIKKQVGDGKVLWLCPAAWIPPWWRRSSSRPSAIGWWRCT